MAQARAYCPLMPGEEIPISVLQRNKTMHIKVLVQIGENKYDTKDNELSLEVDSIEDFALKSIVNSLVESACHKLEVYKHYQKKKQAELPTEVEAPPAQVIPKSKIDNEF